MAALLGLPQIPPRALRPHPEPLGLDVKDPVSELHEGHLGGPCCVTARSQSGGGGVAVAVCQTVPHKTHDKSHYPGRGKATAARRFSPSPAINSGLYSLQGKRLMDQWVTRPGLLARTATQWTREAEAGQPVYTPRSPRHPSDNAPRAPQDPRVYLRYTQSRACRWGPDVPPAPSP